MRTLTVEAAPRPPSTLFGFNMELCEFSDEKDGVTGRAIHNFTLGGMRIGITVKTGEREIEEELDLRPMVEKWIDELVTELKEPS